MTSNREGDDLTLGQNFDRLFEKLREGDTKEKRIGAWIVPVILFMIGQFSLGIWWAADVSARLTIIEQKLVSAASDRYRGADATRDFNIRDDRLDFIQDQIDELEQDNDKLRDKIENIINRSE